MEINWKVGSFYKSRDGQKWEEDFVKEFGDESEILFTNSKRLIRVENPCFVISK